MYGARIVRRGWCLAFLCGPLLPGWCPAQAPTPPVGQPAVVAPGRPVFEAPPHEAVVPAPKDREPVHVEKAPPAPVNERPGVAPPGKGAVSIPGYWEWDPVLKDYAWVAGTWRVPLPGRFWANGYWMRDDRGWYRVPGFWSDRPLDRVAWRKQGPPAEHPEDEPGPSPGEGRFFIPGHFAPDGDGLAWKKGFWTRVQPGWAWVPAQWVRQPEGWTLQEGFWDRPPDDRGTRFAQVHAGHAAREGDTTYQPRPQESPGRSVQIRGSFGRPDSLAGGYVGVVHPGYLSPSVGAIANAGMGAYSYANPASSVMAGNNSAYTSFPSPASTSGAYSYYGHGLGYTPGFYGGSSFGPGLGYYPGYYGGSGMEAGRQSVELGGLGGFPYYGHGLGYYPGFYGP